MASRIIINGVVLIATLTFAAAALADNRIANPRFDDGLEGWEWTDWNEGVDLEMDAEHRRAGEQSLRLTSNPDGDRRVGQGQLTQTISGLEPDVLYRISFQVRADGGQRAWFGNVEGEGPRRYLPTDDNGTYDWQEVELYYRTGEDETELPLMIGFQPSGGAQRVSTWWIDDIRMARIPEDQRAEAQPLNVYLAWAQDPTTTMTVHWHSHLTHIPHEAVRWRPAGETQWHSAEGSTRVLPYSERIVHFAELSGLDPARVYEFRFGEDDDAETFRFRTMPADLDEPVRFVVGGDLYDYVHMMVATNKQAAAQSPMFAALAGDLAYCNGNPERIDRWYNLLDAWQEHMVTPDGLMIPMVLAVGGHEIRRGAGPDARERGPFYFNLFHFPDERSYFVLDFGEYLSMVSLDTDHAAYVEGEQTEWLESVLSERAESVKHIFPFYHVGAYPSQRDFETGSRGTNKRVRENWSPLFERHGVRVAFEAHDHTYKRTHPIRNNEIDESGVVYIGDGAWGVNVREPHPPDETWYLKRAESKRHFILVELENDSVTFTAISNEGEVFDQYELP